MKSSLPRGFVIDERKQSLAARRLNVGCGHHPLLYWTNLDQDDTAFADTYCRVPPLPYADESLDEIYAGHFIEHLSHEDARGFVRECWRCLVPGGRLGVVVPDTREIMKRYLAGASDRVEYPQGTWYSVCDLDDVCRVFLFSTVQASHHQWAYDQTTLASLLSAAGFVVVGEIDRFLDERIPVGAWYQFGLDAKKPTSCAS